MLIDGEIQNRLTQAEHSNGKLPQGITDAKKWEVAQQFQSLFTHEMIKAMRKTVPEDGLTKESNGRQIFEGMLDEKYADLMSHQNSSNGLARTIYHQLEIQDGSVKNTLDEGPKTPIAKNITAFPVQVQSESRPTNNDSIQNTIQLASKRFGVDSNLIQSVIQQESGSNPNAVSASGAQGLMQLMPDTAKSVGVKNPFDPKENIMGGTAFLSKMLHANSGNESLALASYNAGLGNVQKYGGIPPFSETQKYVQQVLQNKKNLDLQSQGAGK